MAAASAGSHIRAMDGPLPDSQPHQAPAESPSARATCDGGEGGEPLVLVQPICSRDTERLDVACGEAWRRAGRYDRR